ncbi:MAG: cofactor-independent phosphoglycerate mutase [Nitrospira sp.]|nr:cofactor-independent phosphoglycerate mutase [Nitrospira sp.]
MKYLVLVGDGMGDHPIESLGRRTPLQAANIPYIHELSKQGLLGLVKTTPEGMTPGSDVTHLSILGYDPRQWTVARAPLEAASLGVSLNPGDVAFRCNLVTLRQAGANGYEFDKIGPGTILEDYSACHIPTEQARELIHDLNDQMGTESIQFYPGLSYRHLMIWIGGKVRVNCISPQDMVGQKVIDCLPKGDGQQLLKDIIMAAAEILTLHPINEERRKEGLKPANGIWLWGQGKSFNLPSFTKRFGVTGTIVAAVELIKGIGSSVGLEVVEVPGATGYLDTNYVGKAQAALKALESCDLVFLHVEAPDEASHEGNLEAKIRAIEDLDRKVVGTIVQEMGRFDELRVLLLCDHRTSVMSRHHTPDPVPFLIFEKSKGSKIRPSGKEYHEASAESAGQIFNDGTQLMNYFLNG